jgi:hypothetical protein
MLNTILIIRQDGQAGKGVAAGLIRKKIQRRRIVDLPVLV